MTHTQTPWKGPCEPDSNFQKGKLTIKTMDGEVVATVTTKNRDNAKFIVKAVNLHDELVEWARLLEKSIVWQKGKLEKEGDMEGSNLLNLNLIKVRETLAKVQP